ISATARAPGKGGIAPTGTARKAASRAKMAENRAISSLRIALPLERKCRYLLLKTANAAMICQRWFSFSREALRTRVSRVATGDGARLATVKVQPDPQG
ncbi:MAG: hypothetical protein NTY59_15910, partial [Alphaproteobacteria bacterium]|nr:hypothetical protein [Alphaproteobacteria bacterium]